MRNPRKPFFYKEKKKKGRAVFGVLIFLAVFIVWAAAIPGVRQIIFPTVVSLGRYLKSFIIPVQHPNALEFLTAPVFIPPDRPDKEVIFAESLTDLQGTLNTGATSNESGVSDTESEEDAASRARAMLPTITPTPGITWVYVNPADNPNPDNVNPIIESSNIVRRLQLPTFERADVGNDGPAALSTVLRFFGYTTHQYAIQAGTRQHYLAPPTLLSDLETYVRNHYPKLATLRRVNGSAETLIALLDMEIPILIRLETDALLPEFRGDDRRVPKTVLVYGNDDATDTFSYRDFTTGDPEPISRDELLARWYPLRREYLAVFPNDRSEEILTALGESEDPKRNLESALEKFRLDVDNLPFDPNSRLNLAGTLASLGQYNEALVNFRNAANLGLPSRLPAILPELYEILYETGNADELIARADYALKLTSADLTARIQKGWGLILKNEDDLALDVFLAAEKDSPNNEDIRYALKYLEEYR